MLLLLIFGFGCFPIQLSYCDLQIDFTVLDFQSRRLDIRYQVEVGNNPFTHTLNATALAVPRILIGLIENHYDRARDCVVLPACLRDAMGTEVIPRTRNVQ
jgi:seryl-tRNA synthetase